MQVSPWLAVIVSCVILGGCAGQNLYAPEFSQSFYAITVPENIKIGLTLFTVTVTDEDTGGSSGIKFMLNDTTNFLITRSGDVEYYGGLDYEKPELREIALSITATDSGTPPKSTSVPLYINVTNINDETPTCAKPVFQGEVLNGAPAGTEILQVQAIDNDFNTRLTYNLTVPNSYFQVNRQTGMVTTSQVVDLAAILAGEFENFRVRASDGLRNNLCTVMITIKDPNFHEPKFSKTLYESSLNEGSPAQRVSVLTVKATDDDIGAQKTLTYSLIPTMYSDNFEIDSSSGEIWFVGSIDRENMTSPRTVTLIVEAVDSGVPPAMANATVNIVINDVDDNGPTFPSNYYEFEMIRKFPKGVKITSLPKAVDVDQGENAVVSYNLSAEGLTVFDVDRSTGDITTKIMCSQSCILTNTAEFEFRLFAYNKADPSVEGDSVLIRMRLVENLATTPSRTISMEDITQTSGQTKPNPDQSTQNPDHATQKPGRSTQNPGQTTQNPGQGTQNPDKTTQNPGQGTQNPDKTTQNPGQGTQNPDQTTPKPGQGTQKPDQTTQKPGQGTQNPDNTTQKPGRSTQNPGQTTEKADQGAQNPDKTTQNPGQGTQSPGQTTPKLGQGTQKPDKTTQNPGQGTQNPDKTTQNPGQGTQSPGQTTPKPGQGTQKPDQTTQKSGQTTQKLGSTTRKSLQTTQRSGQTPSQTTRKSGQTTQTAGQTTQKSGQTTEKTVETTRKSGQTTQTLGLTTQKPSQNTRNPGQTTQKPVNTTHSQDDRNPKFSSDLHEFDMVKQFPQNLKITSLPKAVVANPIGNTVISYNLSAEGLTVFDIDESTGDITTKISCSQTCILINKTQFEFNLFAFNKANPSMEGDSILIRIRLVERLTPTPNLSGGDGPTTGALPVRGDTTEEPDLTVEEVVAIVVVVCCFLFLVFVIILVLLVRGSKIQRKKDRIDFNPSSHPVRKMEAEVR